MTSFIKILYSFTFNNNLLCFTAKVSPINYSIKLSFFLSFWVFFFGFFLFGLGGYEFNSLVYFFFWLLSLFTSLNNFFDFNDSISGDIFSYNMSSNTKFFFNPLSDIDVSSSTDSDDLIVFIADIFEFSEHEQALLFDTLTESMFTVLFASFSVLSTSLSVRALKK